jgi:hypothetical protein
VLSGLVTGQVVLRPAVALIPGNLIKLLVEAQVLNGLVTPLAARQAHVGPLL